MTEDDVPPLFTDYTSAGADPWPLACAAAADGTDAGLVIHDLGDDWMRAAVVFAPDLPLRQSAAMLPLCGVALQRALGILGPPALVVQLGCDGGVFVNGAGCGMVTISAATDDPDRVPDWLVIGLTLHWADDGAEGGEAPDTTTLQAEGCGEVSPAALLAGWLRQVLLVLDTWQHDGMAELHAAWTGMARGLDDTCAIAGTTGTLIGADADLNPLLKTGDRTRMMPLTTFLRKTA
ncbi:Biotin-(acetyl-CoA carboxylase) ligase [Loktanella atrilutea]|uniref:Biotin-(Acetyl-CoA carboxylase) ligase n=1 Tax=Loktanella atrilutea TaxID=366533 RepID=A0A1M4THQ6_LOKAT|nr:biotin/lipoate--protein ligase family protein [Loktanella atrilutea]SHE43864.1 Biotin-(acetyl-CoA carboxylase) ligase [Loktanella atrilutea]